MDRGSSFQHTIEREVQCEGIGLHSGAMISMRMKPAPPDHGIRFRRLDVGNDTPIVAHPHRVVDTQLATTIGLDGVTVSTVEHLMAALSAAGVDNVMVELDGPEIPIFDGSAAHHVRMLNKAGLCEQDLPRRFLRVTRPIVVRDGESHIKASPGLHFSVRYTIDFPHPQVGHQEFSWSFDRRGFQREIAGARTFGFLREVQYLQSRGLARGGSLDNAMVFDERGLLNQEGFRYSDECVRHKILDLLGDLALAGMPVLGEFEAHKAGHALHCRLLKQLLAEPDSYATALPATASKPHFQAPIIPSILDGFHSVLSTH